LPSGKELAELVRKSFAGQLDGPSWDGTDDLSEIGEAISSLPGGLRLLQKRIVRLANFDSAMPTLAHRLLALLLAEGAVKVMTTNWDDCVERGWNEERIQAARNIEEARELEMTHVLKVHGCCTLPPTLVITKTQLEEPPLWVEWISWGEFIASTVVFVGVGDIASYVREPIASLTEVLSAEFVRLVSRSIESDWEGSEWSTVLPSLPTDNRIGMTADDFMDQLARGWLLTNLLSQLRNTNECITGSACFDAFGGLTAAEVLAWLRFAATKSLTKSWGVGKSVVRSPEALGALLSICMIAERMAENDPNGGQMEIRVQPRASVVLNGHRFEVIIGSANQSSATLERDARRRAEAAMIETGDVDATVLCSAAMPIGPRQDRLMPSDLMAVEAKPGDLIAGPTQVSVKILWADHVLQDWSRVA
jgi:hypothetical protein